MRAIHRMTFAATLAVALSGVAWAENGCYARAYSPAHLADHPKQVVAKIVLQLSVSERGDREAGLWVETANQGHVAASGHGGQVFEQGLTCFDQDGHTACAVECDGGWFDVVRSDAAGMTIETAYLMVGDTESCGGAVDLAEIPQQPVRYRLERVAPSVCKALSED